MEECAALRPEVGKLEKGLATLRDAHEANEEKIQGLELQVALDAEAIFSLAILVTDYRLDFL